MTGFLSSVRPAGRWLQVQRLCLWVLACLLLAGCESAYYSTMEKVGIHKRDILTDRIEGARDAQEAAKQQFRSALERFSTELGFEGGDLEAKYEALRDEFEASETRADAVRDRIAAVESVADALFEEWEEELTQYSSSSLRRQSANQLKTTQRRYQRMLRAMHTAEKRMTPVLDTFRDQVLYLKHNLNARAIASLRSEFGSLKQDINSLIRDMEASIEQANQFIESLAETS
mgnify:CR=1 FL=1